MNLLKLENYDSSSGRNNNVEVAKNRNLKCGIHKVKGALPSNNKKKEKKKDKEKDKDKEKRKGENKESSNSANGSNINGKKDKSQSVEEEGIKFHDSIMISEGHVRKMKKMMDTAKKCPTGFMSSERATEILNDYLKFMVEMYGQGNIVFDASEIFTPSITIAICHRVAEILAAEPTLVSVEFDEGNKITVGSDCHGSMDVLLNIFDEKGAPPEKILFMGDYTDKGESDTQILLLLFLLKIMYPSQVILLRGNHEIKDMNRLKDFPNNCQIMLGSSDFYYVFNYVFERMPISAIIDDQIYLAHGGVSPWINSRSDILSIQRPLKINRGIVPRLIISDILWSDPYRKEYDDTKSDTKFFAPSKRGCGYAYSQKGLQAIMSGMNVNMVIRGHQTSTEGYRMEYTKICHTIHSKPGNRHGKGATGILRRMPDGTVNLKSENTTPDYSNEKRIEIIEHFRKTWCHSENKLEESNWDGTCQSCEKMSCFINELACQERVLITHVQLVSWAIAGPLAELIKIDLGRSFKTDESGFFKFLSRFPTYLEFLMAGKDKGLLRLKSIVGKAELKLQEKLRKGLTKNASSTFTFRSKVKIDDLPMLGLNGDLKLKRNKNNFTMEDGNSENDSSSESENKDMSEDEGAP
uniref:Serine/threonine-protein phosphatase n=1 Tax=Rhabditophanes sp. KR3021 TaxID=114890 RepID=A0AC35UAI8_9BILA